MPVGMADAATTVAGIGSGLALVLAPKVWERLTGRRKDAADGATVLSTGASAVTSAALALLEQHEEDAQAARAAEAKCRVDLAAANQRIDHGDAERHALRREIDELRSTCQVLQAKIEEPPGATPPG